jgi:hypothetical protein
MFFYVNGYPSNGFPITSYASSASILHSGSTFYIGKIGTVSIEAINSINNLSLGSDSLIDDFRFYNKALQIQEIIGLYNIVKFTNTQLTPYQYRNAYKWLINKVSSSNYLLYANSANIVNLCNTFHNKNGFSIHFVFSVSDLSKTFTILRLESENRTFINIQTNLTNIRFTVNTNNLDIPKTNFSNNTYCVVDFIYSINVYAKTCSFKVRINNSTEFTSTSSAYSNTFYNIVDEGLKIYLLFKDKLISAILQDFRIYPYALTPLQVTALQTGATSYQAFTGSPIIETYQIERWKDGGAGANKFIYYNEGKVGIGNSAPEAPLHVGSEAATSTTYTGKYFTLNDATVQTATNTSTAFSAKFDSSILVKNSIVASSDARIKKNIQDINDDGALDKILSIQPKTYNYIDPIRGEDTVYGFIAQQIREVIPEAVKIQKAIIPNVFCVAECFLNVITFDHDISAYGMASGTKVSIIDRTGNQSIYTIVNDPSETNSIVLDRNISGDKVFVYGTEIDDFHALDKNYIFTLNVCATQRLSQKIDNLMHRIAYLEYLSANVE